MADTDNEAVLRPSQGLTVQEVKSPKLTVKQRMFLKAYLDPKSQTFGNGTKTALKIYDCKDYSTAQVIASENLSKLKNPIRTLMEARGIGLDKLLNTLNDGLLAKKIHTSHTEPDREVPDHAVRHKYLETAGKWLGVEDGRTQINSQVNVQINADKFFEE